MSATAYADDFVDLSGWTASGMTVASGEVKASADNAAIGKLTRTHESVAPPANNTVTVRVGFDFVVDTTMTAGTQVSVALLDAGPTFGTCVLIKQGVGIQSGYYATTPNGFGSPTTLLAWASLVNGGRYHIEWTINPTNFFGFVSLYDPTGNLVSRATTNQSSVAWYNITRLVIESNSTKTTVSRLAIDPSLLGSATTGKHFTNVATYTYFQPLDSTAVDFYIPGGGNITQLGEYCHGAGQSINFIELTTVGPAGTVVNGLLRGSVMMLAPNIPATSGGGDSWGNDYGAASALAAIAYARSLIGNATAPVHLIAYSMGTLTAVRLFANDGLKNVRSLYIRSGPCDLAYMEQSSSFAAAIDTAWGVSSQANYAAAQATFARGNPLGLLGSNAGRFSGIIIAIEYSTTGDTTVSQANNCVPFEALLTTKNIAHKTSLKPYATHTETSTVGDAAMFLSQVLGSSGGGRQCGPMSLML